MKVCDRGISFQLKLHEKGTFSVKLGYRRVRVGTRRELPPRVKLFRVLPSE